MEESPIFTFKINVNASVAEAFRMFRHETALRDWLCERAIFEGKEQGNFFLIFPNNKTVHGKVLNIEPERHISFEWFPDGDITPSMVDVSISSAGTASQVNISHQQPDEFVQKNWPFWIENYQSVLESGIDLRLARRPRLGIFIQDFDPAVVTKLGIPAQNGILLGGTAEGSGAQAAGILKDDLIIQFGSQAVKDYDSLGVALEPYRAGDKPEVIFYSGSQQMKVNLELSSFPVFNAPEPAELARRFRETQIEVMAGWEGLLKGVTDHQAESRYTDHGWNAKEILAHFILCERDYQGWVADMLNDTPVEDWLEMRPNAIVRVQALVRRMPELSDLMKECAAAKEETADMLDHLPHTFFEQRKHLYRKAAQWAPEEVPSHYYDQHKEQIVKALASVETS